MLPRGNKFPARIRRGDSPALEERRVHFRRTGVAVSARAQRKKEQVRQMWLQLGGSEGGNQKQTGPLGW